jgi:phage gp29-like protein
VAAVPAQVARSSLVSSSTIDGETLRLKTLGVPEDLAGFKYITHVHPAKSGLPIRGGLARPAAWAYLFKNLRDQGLGYVPRRLRHAAARREV